MPSSTTPHRLGATQPKGSVAPLTSSSTPRCVVTSTMFGLRRNRRVGASSTV